MTQKSNWQSRARNVAERRKLRRWFGRDGVTKVTAVVDDYVTYCLEQDLQQTTINTCVNAVRMYFEYLAEKGLVQGNPVLKRHKKTVYLHPHFCAG